MDVQRDIDDVIDDLVYNELQDVLICYLDELLAEVVSELIDHDVSDDWKHELNQILIKNVITACLDFLLEHSAPRLVKAIELDVVEDLLILHAQFVHGTFNIIQSRVTFTTLHGRWRGRPFDFIFLHFLIKLIIQIRIDVCENFGSHWPIWGALTLWTLLGLSLTVMGALSDLPMEPCWVLDLILVNLHVGECWCEGIHFGISLIGEKGHGINVTATSGMSRQ